MVPLTVKFEFRKAVNEHELPCKVLCSDCHSPMADEGRRTLLLFPEAIDLDAGNRGPDSIPGESPEEIPPMK